MKSHSIRKYPLLLRMLAMLLLACLLLPTLAACRKDTEDDEADGALTEPGANEETTMTIPNELKLVSAGGFVTNGTTLTANIVSEDASFDFNSRIRVNLGTTWCLTEDKSGDTELEDKTVTLNEGENRFYIKTKFRDDSQVYEAIVNYHAAYAVEFYSNCNMAVATQQVDFGKKAVAPADPVREGYTFDGWFRNGKEYNFDAVPTESFTLIAHWTKKDNSFSASDTSVPTFTSIGASLSVVWKDYANSNGLRPDSVTCELTERCSGATTVYEIVLSKNSATWKDPNNRPDGAVLTQGDGGDWTLAIRSLPEKKDGKYCTYALKQVPLEGDYETLQSSTSAINTVAGYMPSVDASAQLTTRNSRLYDAAGNMIVLRGVVSYNVGVSDLTNSVTVNALSKLKSLGCNGIRLTAQLIGRTAGQGYVYYNNGSSRTGDYNDSNATRMSESDKKLMINEIDEVIKNATEVGLYIVIDWGILTSNPYQYVNEACEFFGILADKYADNPYVIYEICNEPQATWGRSNGEENSIKAYAERVIDTIRQAGSNAIIILAPNNCATALSAYSGKSVAGDDPIDDPLDDDRRYNVAYTFHCYPYNYAYTTYSWKLRDAHDAGLTVITTEMSPMDGTFGAPDKLTYDMEEAAKFQRMYVEWDMSFFYFRYASQSGATSPYNENLMFLPNLNLNTRDWDRDDLTECGKWYFDWITDDGVWPEADFNTPRKKDFRPNYDTTHSAYGLGNIFPGFASSATKDGSAYFFKVNYYDSMTDIQFENYCTILWQMIATNSTGTAKKPDGTAFSANDIPTTKSDTMQVIYTYKGKTYNLSVVYGSNAQGDAYGITVSIY